MIPDFMLPFANHLWQSTLFVIAVGVIVLMFRKNRAAVRHRLWLAASVKFLVPFSLLAGMGNHLQWQTALVTPPRPVSLIVETLSQPFSASSPSLIPPGSIPPPRTSRFPAVLVGVWIVGVAASLLWWFIRWWKVRRAVRLATPSDLDGPIRVMRSPQRFEPGVFGIFRPVLLLPEGITERLSPVQLQAVLAHELCHVRRRDNLAMAIHLVVEALFWFYPLVWFIKVRLLEEQERACDEEVLRLGGEPQVYAESILKVCEFYLTSPLICISGIAGSNLKKRIEDIMKNQVALKLSWSRVLFLVVAAIAALACPILFGIAPVSASAAKRTAQVQVPRAAPAQIATVQGALKESARTSSVIQEYHVGEIRVTGAALLQNDVVRSLVGLASNDVFNEARLSWGIMKLRERYASLGYIRFDAQPVLQFDEQKKIVNLTVNIAEGSQFTVGEIRVTGARILHPDFIRSSLRLASGEVFNETRLRESFKDLARLYGSLGYADFVPEPAMDFDERQKIVNLIVNIDEGRQFTVDRIIFTGNATTPDEVIRREILLKEGGVFNASLWDLSVSRLNQLGLFEDIKEEDTLVDPSRTETKVDITLRVKEKGR